MTVTGPFQVPLQGGFTVVHHWRDLWPVTSSALWGISHCSQDTSLCDMNAQTRKQWQVYVSLSMKRNSKIVKVIYRTTAISLCCTNRLSRAHHQMWFLGRERKKTKPHRKKENHQVKQSGGQDKRCVEEKQKKWSSRHGRKVQQGAFTPAPRPHSSLIWSK